jgi:hypothetical protein
MKKQLAVFVVFLALVGGTAPAVLAEDDHGGYLALGDSIPFGFNPLIPPAQRANPSNFVGYPEVYAAMHGLILANLSCPGETSGSMISTPTPANPDNGCRRYRSRFRLHTSYTGTQLSFALAYLQAHSNVALVSISIGHNDLGLLEKACNNDAACELEGLPSVLTRLDQNLRTIYTAIRGVGYKGSLVAVTYYAADYRDTTEVRLISAVDRVLAEATRDFDGDVGDGFRAFRKTAVHFDGSSCTAGLLIVLTHSPRTCDFHPAAAGRDLLVRTMGQVVDD